MSIILQIVAIIMGCIMLFCLNALINALYTACEKIDEIHARICGDEKETK